MRNLSSGRARARMRSLGSCCFSSSSVNSLKRALVRTRPPGVSIGSSASSIRPISWPMARAVSTLSPVIILTSMPASRHWVTASLTSARSGSRMATKPAVDEPLLQRFAQRVQPVLVGRRFRWQDAIGKRQRAHRLARPPRAAAARIAWRLRRSRAVTLPSAAWYVLAAGPSSHSGAPLTRATRRSP